MGTSVGSSRQRHGYGFEPSPRWSRRSPRSVRSPGPRRYDSPGLYPDPFDDRPCRAVRVQGPAKSRPRDRARLRAVRAPDASRVDDAARRRGCLRRSDQAPRHRAAADDHGAGDVLRRSGACRRSGWSSRPWSAAPCRPGSANTLNCVYDRDIDEQMRRTRRRALPRHTVTPALGAWSSGSSLGGRLDRSCSGCSSTGSRPAWRSRRTCSTCSATRWCSSVVRRRTSSGAGSPGCFPTLIGWTAVTNELAWPPVVLFLVVFFWTPPHTWALAMRYREDYASVDVPMLPVVDATPTVSRGRSSATPG